MKFIIERFDPDQDQKPYFKEYDIQLEPSDRMLLDALIRIKSIDDTLALFGPGRCLYGSNFPIEKMWTTYAHLLGVMRDCLSHLPAADQRAVFHDNAMRLYRP